MVTDFSPSSPTSSYRNKSRRNSTLTLSFQSLNGFQGSLSLSTTVSPSGPMTTLTHPLCYYRLITIAASSQSSSRPAPHRAITLSPSKQHLEISSTRSPSPSWFQLRSVGGLIIPIDKLGLVIQLLPTGTSILVVLASALAGVGTARNRSKRRALHLTTYGSKRSSRVALLYDTRTFDHNLALLEYRRTIKERIAGNYGHVPKKDRAWSQPLMGARLQP